MVVSDATEAVPPSVEQVEEGADDVVEGVGVGFVDDLAVNDAEVTATPGDLLGFIREQREEGALPVAGQPVPLASVVGSDLVQEEAERVVGVLHRDAPIAPSLHETAARRSTDGATGRIARRCDVEHEFV